MTSLTIDGFIPHWNELRDYADRAHYADTVNPTDGVVYPGICAEIPISAKQAILNALSAVYGRTVTPNLMFMRLSPKGVKAPHQAHTDSTMGQYSMMLYMNRLEHSKGGTSLIQHKATGMQDDSNLSPLGERVWLRDTNDYGAWSITKLAHMQPNRAFIFPAKMFHRAEPVEGFGNNPKNARLVLTVFFNL